MTRNIPAIIGIAISLVAATTPTPVKKWYARNLPGAQYVYTWKACQTWSTPQYSIPSGKIYQVDPVKMPGGQQFNWDGFVQDGTVNVHVWAVRVMGAPITQSFYLKETCIVGAEYR